MEELYTMSKEEMSRLEVMQKLLTRQWKQERASQVLNISIRQVQRLLSTYRAQGVSGLVSKKRGKPSNHRIPEFVKEYAANLIKKHYADFSPTLATEKLLG